MLILSVFEVADSKSFFFKQLFEKFDFWQPATFRQSLICNLNQLDFRCLCGIQRQKRLLIFYQRNTAVCGSFRNGNMFFATQAVECRVIRHRSLVVKVDACFQGKNASDGFI